jgi:hypothetical protein
LTDAGASGAANMLREIPKFYLQDDDWQTPTLRCLAELFLLVQAAKNSDKLSETLGNELLVTAGITIKSSSLLENKDANFAEIVDTWQVLGEKSGKTIDDALQYRRTWLRGKTNGLYAVFLDYDFSNKGYKTNYTVGTEWQGDLVFYPANAGLRAFEKTKQAPPFKRFETTFAYANFSEFQEAVAKQTAAAPWLKAMPCTLQEATPYFYQKKHYLIDCQGFMLPLSIKEMPFWKLLAISGNAPITVFGEWVYDKFEPLSGFSAGQWIAF